MRVMFESNQELEAAKTEVSAKEYERSAARGLFFPVVSVSSMYTHLSDPLELDLNPVRDAIARINAPYYAGVTPAVFSSLPAANQQAVVSALQKSMGDWNKTLQKQDLWTNSVSVRQPLWTGGKIIAANKAAAARVDEAGEKYHYTRNKLVTELVERYFGYRLLIKVVDVRKEVLDGMEKHLSDAAALETSGIISRAERLHAEVARADADREYKKSRRDADIAQTALLDTLAVTIDTRPSTPLFMAEKVESLDYFKHQAKERNPMLKQIIANKTLARQAYMKELAGFSPDIFAFGSYDIYGWQKSAYVPEWFAGVGATMTLFEGGANYNRKKAADAQMERVSLIEKKAHADILALVEKNYGEMMKSREQLDSLDTSLSFAKEYLRVREKAFKEGVAASTDLTDAQLNLSQAKIQRLKALYEYDLALARLLEVCGISEQFETFRNEASVEVER
jgi:outer membrane protein TolC